MKQTIPLMPLPYKPARGIIRSMYPATIALINFFPSLNGELERARSDLNAKEYLGGAIFAFIFYFIAMATILGIWAGRMGILGDMNGIMIVGLASVSIALAIFIYIVIFPKWMMNTKLADIERNLLFATRHLMIQTTAGVNVFDAIVSVSEEYGDKNLDYGEISKEFRQIVKEVRSGKNLTDALEESAARNPSKYYRRVLWQLANSNKAGTDVGDVLKNIVEFLSNEQRIMIRDYGSQLNPLALFYMFTCILAPTMGLIFIMIMSTFVEIPVTEVTFGIILIFLVVVQIMFIGLIKSRRPKVAL